MTASPKVPVDVTKETRGEIVELLEKVEQSGKWPQQTCTTMFFLIRKNVTSERPIALMPTLIRGRNGGAQQTVWEILLEMERFDGKAKEEDQGALASVFDESSCGVGLCVAEPLQTIAAILPGSKWSCLLLRIVCCRMH